MSFIEITGGFREDAFNGADGVYAVTLVGIGEPRTVIARSGPRAGQEIQLIDWDFAVENAPAGGSMITGATTTASGPQSKMFSWLTALFEGKSPPVGTRLEKKQLIGRRALATIRRDNDGWLKIENLGALPVEMRGRPAPVAATSSPQPQPADELPF
jgi:hypothetical protein